MPRTKFDLHPSFQKKRVVELECKFCGNYLCHRGMKAILLADTNLELYSTDFPPNSAVAAVGDPYHTDKCHCQITDIACLTCGNVVGYHVMLPCKPCLQSCNNGHFWMFHSSVVCGRDRTNDAGTKLLQWGDLPSTFEEEKMLQDQCFEMMEECYR